MTPRQAWNFLRRWLWLCLLGTLLAGGASYLFSLQLPKVYEGRVRLLVTPGSATNGAVDYSGIQAAQSLTRTYSELAKARPVVQAAVTAGGLALAYEDAAAVLEAAPVRDTQLIQLTARAGDPDQAAALANLVAAALIQQAQASQSSRFAASRDSLAKQLDQLGAEVAKRTEQGEALQGQAPSADRDGQLTRAQFELAQLQQTYTTVARSYEDVRLNEARSTDLLAVVDPATPSRTPVQPQVLRNVLLAAFVGLLLGAGVAFLAESLDDRLFSPERVTRFTGLSALGTVWLSRKGAPSTIDQLPAHKPSASGAYYNSRAAQAYRLLSANLQFASVGHPLRTLLVTSSKAGEGKTTTAANLAIVEAQAGKKVVLVDADLHAPALHKAFGVPNRTGLTSLLVNDRIAPAGALVQTRVAGLQLLPSGPLPPNPSELLASQRMRAQLAHLAESADLMIVDSSPVLEVGDPAVLAGLADGVLLVADARRTRGHDAGQALAMLRKAGAHVVGAVLNRMPDDGTSYHGTHEYAQDVQLRPTAR